MKRRRTTVFPVPERAGRLQHSSSVVLLATVVLVLGCPGQQGPKKYEVTGAITYGGEPLLFGEIFFEPLDVPATIDTYGRAIINEGRYSGEIVGGWHLVHVRGISCTDGLNLEELKGLVSFPDWHGFVDFPSLEAVTSREESGPVEIDIEISKGPEKYEVTGMVTYDGQPTPWAEMMIQPEGDSAYTARWSYGRIYEGRYSAQIAGGPHLVTVRELPIHPDHPMAARLGMFQGDLKCRVDFPALEEATGGEDSGPVEFNIEIPVEKR